MDIRQTTAGWYSTRAIKQRTSSIERRGSNSGRDSIARSLRKRSQSLGFRVTSSNAAKLCGVPPGSEEAKKPTTVKSTKMSAALPKPREAPTLNLYHVPNPEPRARWVFNLSTQARDKRTDHSPTSAPIRVAATTDPLHPELGSLVWINATLGGHCCLQKGSKTKTVTPVFASVIDGWLNGQVGLWWLGALKDQHQRIVDSHVVMSWAMVFIPATPEIAAKNNMEVWKDKCIPGSLRVARPGELVRKIIDIVSDDQDAEPYSVVHTHLCILLADGDDLELRRPRMMGTPRASDTGLGGFDSNAGGVRHPARDASPARKGQPELVQSLSVGDIPKDVDYAGRAHLPRGRSNSVGAGRLSSGGGEGGSAGQMSFQEALGRLERYRDRIRSLKDDRHSKKAALNNLHEELRGKEESHRAEADRLRRERNSLRSRAKSLRGELEKMKRQSADLAAMANPDDVAQLRADVDRLRQERNDARSEAMRWLEEQQQHEQTSRSAERGSSSSTDEDAIVELRAQVEKLRQERDEAEQKAAQWLREQEKIMLTRITNAHANVPDGSNRVAGGPVVAGLKAESARLRVERDEAKAEAKIWKEKAANVGSSLHRTSSSRALQESPEGFGLDSEPLEGRTREETSANAKKALAQLLGKALNLLTPKEAAEAAAEAAATAAAKAHSTDTTNEASTFGSGGKTDEESISSEDEQLAVM